MNFCVYFYPPNSRHQKDGHDAPLVEHPLAGPPIKNIFIGQEVNKKFVMEIDLDKLGFFLELKTSPKLYKPVIDSLKRTVNIESAKKIKTTSGINPTPYQCLYNICTNIFSGEYDDLDKILKGIKKLPQKENVSVSLKDIVRPVHRILFPSDSDEFTDAEFKKFILYMGDFFRSSTIIITATKNGRYNEFKAIRGSPRVHLAEAGIFEEYDDVSKPITSCSPAVKSFGEYTLSQANALVCANQTVLFFNPINNFEKLVLAIWTGLSFDTCGWFPISLAPTPRVRTRGISIKVILFGVGCFLLILYYYFSSSRPTPRPKRVHTSLPKYEPPPPDIIPDNVDIGGLYRGPSTSASRWRAL